jgi:hypothetical protein
MLLRRLLPVMLLRPLLMLHLLPAMLLRPKD